MTKIPVNEALLLVRDFGLLINQAAIYGVTHRVIQQQAGGVFNRLHSLVKAHETVEFSIKGDKLAVNGEIEGMDIMSTRNLKERMVLHKLPGILFSAQLSQEEFLSFLSHLAKPPVRIQEMGGFEQVLKNATVKGVSLVHLVYERVDSATPKEAPPPPPEAQNKKTVPKQQKSEQNSTYEIVLEEELDEVADSEESEKPVTGKASRERKKIQAELDSLISEVTELIVQEGGSQNSQMVEKLRSIRDTLKTSTETSRERIATFLEPETRPELPTSMESAQKDKFLNLRHSEYMQRFAELTQEIAQPLTITNSVIELLGKGQAGPLTESQSSFLALALESVDRVNQLIKYMHTLYGEPDSYIPDASFIQETYQ
jgi:hypothetical protein